MILDPADGTRYAMEIEEFCQMQTEISKLELQQKQWKEMEEKQAKEEQFAFVGTPPTSPR